MRLFSKCRLTIVLIPHLWQSVGIPDVITLNEKSGGVKVEWPSYFAYSTMRDSLRTVTLISPG